MPAIIPLLLALAATPLAAAEWWDFKPRPDAFGKDALLDLRGLNEEESGRSGFIRVDAAGTGFLRGDGVPIRFWGVASNPNTAWSPQDIEGHFRFLAKRGVNLVRMHCHIANESEGAKITDIDERELDTIFRYVAAAKRNGIYILISPYWYHRKIPASWGLEGYRGGEMPVASLFWNEAYQDAFRAWMRRLYTTVNPHTGLAIGQDPTVAMLKMKNEDSLFFWTSLTKEIPQAQLDLLRARFAAWAREEYGALPRAIASWQGQPLADDDLDQGRLGFFSVYDMTQADRGGRRMRDQLRFLAGLQRGFYVATTRYLKEELGCRQLSASMSWRSADKQRLEDIERWTYTANEVLTQNIYVQPAHQGENKAWRVDAGDHFTSLSCTREPWLLPTNLKQTVGMPTIINEIAWVTPNRYQSEGPTMTAAYQGLSSIAATCWFGMSSPQWAPTPYFPFAAKGHGRPLVKWNGNQPMEAGMFPAAALIQRFGLVSAGPTLVHEERRLAALWDREEPIISEGAAYDASQDAVDQRGEYQGGRVSRLAFLCGRVEVAVSDESKAASRVGELAPLIDNARQRVVSATGELVSDFGQGLWRCRAPAAQAAAGFLGAQPQPIDCGSLRLTCRNDYATVTAVSLDARPLGESARVLVQVGTVVLPKGWRTSPATFTWSKRQITGERIDETGNGPLQVESADCRIELANPGLTRATALDPNGYAAGSVELARNPGGVAFAFPPTALYCLLSAE